MKINLACSNIKNLKSNLVFANNLINNNDIIYFCETWLKNNEKYVANDINSTNKHKVLFKSDMNIEYNKGRPFGGQTWFINKNFKIRNYKFVNKNLSFVNIDIKETLKINIIGVYLPFDDNSHNAKIEYDQCLTEIKAAMVDNELNIIMGDFNADPYRKRRFDKLLQELINENHLIASDMINTQVCNFTFSFTNNNIPHYAHIDHILISNSNLIHNFQSNIIYSDLNTSDHNHIELNIELRDNQKLDYNMRNDQNVEQLKVKSFEIINYDSPEILKLYRDSIDKAFIRLYETFLDPVNKQIRSEYTITSNIYEIIVKAIIEAHKSTLEFQNSLYKEQSNNLNNKNKWFNFELKSIKYKIITKRNQYKVSQDKTILDEIKILKKEFRSLQRKSVYNIEKKETNKIERLSKIKNRKISDAFILQIT